MLHPAGASRHAPCGVCDACVYACDAGSNGHVADAGAAPAVERDGVAGGAPPEALAAAVSYSCRQ